MGGAYAAKPPADTTPDVPPGWDIDWPHPGVSPPGYEMDLSLGMTGQSSMVPGVPTNAMPVTLSDHETYATQEPTGTITFTAKWEDTEEAVGVKFSGDSNFFFSLADPFIGVGDDFWGAEPEFEFDTEGSDVGRTIILNSSSDPYSDGENVETTKEILVVGNFEYLAEISVVSVYPTIPTPSAPYGVTERGFGAKAFFHKEGIGYWVQPFARSGISFYQYYTPGWTSWHYSWPEPDNAEYYLQSGDLTYAAPSTSPEYILGTSEIIGSFKTIVVLDSDSVYELELDQTDGTNIQVTYTYTIKIYESGTLKETVSKNRTIADGGLGVKELWLTVDGETGEVTIINP